MFLKRGVADAKLTYNVSLVTYTATQIVNGPPKVEKKLSPSQYPLPKGSGNYSVNASYITIDPRTLVKQGNSSQFSISSE